MTSRATALILISDRTGRCTRLPTIILFIMERSQKVRTQQLASPLTLITGIHWWHMGGTRLWPVQMHDLGSRWLLQRKLIVPQRLVELRLQQVERDVVLFLRPENLDARRKSHAVIVLVAGVTRIGCQIAALVVNILAVGLQIGPAENDFARKSPAHLAFPDYHQFVVFLQDAMAFRVVKNLVAVLQNSNLAFGLDGTDQQRVVDILWPDALHRLVSVMRLGIISAHYKTILRRNPQPELIAVADHVESRGAHDGQ